MMDDIKANFADDELSTHGRNRMFLFVAVSIVLSAVLVIASMYLYNTSGAAQLDLSRPGYKSIRSQASGSSDFQTYSETGSVNESSINEFKELFEKQVSKIKSSDAFGKDTLNPDSLGVNSESSSAPE